MSPTVATAVAPSRPTKNTSVTANTLSSAISITIGTASRRMARGMGPTVRSSLDPRSASLSADGMPVRPDVVGGTAGGSTTSKGEVTSAKCGMLGGGVANRAHYGARATGSFVAAGLNNNPRSPSTYQRINAHRAAYSRGASSDIRSGGRACGADRAVPVRSGIAMHALAVGSTVPWHCVVNASGGVSPRGDSSGVVTQRLLLEQEGVRFGPRDRISLRVYGWKWRPNSSAGVASRRR